MRKVGRAVILCCGAIALSIGPTVAQGAPGKTELAKRIDLDPLREFLPRDDIFMQVPGGVLAVEDGGTPEDTVEQRRQNRNGGLVVGYCLRASCSHVTHLAVLQVCASQTGGPDGTDHLILGIVRLPFGETPGYLMALRGRDYVTNFFFFVPFVQPFVDAGTDDVTALYALSAHGMGPVAPLEYQGLSVKDDQSPDTIALQMELVRDRISGAQFPRFEVRHYCRRHVS